MIRPARLALLLTVTSAAFCAAASCSSSDSTSTSTSNGSGGASASSSSSSGEGGGLSLDGGSQGGQGGGSAACDPPDVLIMLDRTLTMHKTPSGATPADPPDYASSKWFQAIAAIDQLVAPPLNTTVRFGLELWPKEADGCITLAERVENTKQATNMFCEAGEIVVPPALSTGPAIQAALDPKTTKICVSTPTGSALLTGLDHLKTIAAPGRPQYVALVTDGADWDQSCPDPNPLNIVQQMATDGVKTFIVGFSAEGEVQPGGVGAGFLNDMACAGHTAKGFPAPCKQMGAGYVASDPSGPALYLQAGNGGELSSALKGIATEVCCDCPK
jgi:hypothetical protein